MNRWGHTWKSDGTVQGKCASYFISDHELLSSYRGHQQGLMQAAWRPSLKMCLIYLPQYFNPVWNSSFSWQVNFPLALPHITVSMELNWNWKSTCLLTCTAHPHSNSHTHVHVNLVHMLPSESKWTPGCCLCAFILFYTWMYIWISTISFSSIFEYILYPVVCGTFYIVIVVIWKVYQNKNIWTQNKVCI